AAAGSVHEIDVELVLIAVENLHVDDIFVHPAEAGDVVVVFALLAGEPLDVYPMRPATIGIDYTDSNLGIWVSSIRILLLIDGRMVRNVIGDWILGNLHLVHL